MVTPRTYWLTGLPCSGKSTIGGLLYNKVKSNITGHIVWLDGEDIRRLLGNRYGYSYEDRLGVANHIADLANGYNYEGKSVIVSAVANRRSLRETVRKKIDNYFEVYLKCPPGTCAARDGKGNYKKAFLGEFDYFPGVTEPYEESDPEMIIDTSVCDADQACGLIYAMLIDLAL